MSGRIGIQIREELTRLWLTEDWAAVKAYLDKPSILSRDRLITHLKWLSLLFEEVNGASSVVCDDDDRNTGYWESQRKIDAYRRTMGSQYDYLYQRIKYSGVFRFQIGRKSRDSIHNVLSKHPELKQKAEYAYTGCCNYTYYWDCICRDKRKEFFSDCV